MPSARSSRLLRTTCCTLLLGGLLLFVLVHERAVAQAPAYEVHPDYLVKHFTVEDGHIAIPDRPGLGVTIDEDFVRAHRVDPAA